MNIKPLGDRVLVKPLNSEEVTKSGIVLPDTAEKEHSGQGEIIAIGDGEKIRKMNLQIGDKIWFGKYSGDEVKVDKEEYKFIEEKDILGIIN